MNCKVIFHYQNFNSVRRFYDIIDFVFDVDLNVLTIICNKNMFGDTVYFRYSGFISYDVTFYDCSA